MTLLPAIWKRENTVEPQLHAETGVLRIETVMPAGWRRRALPKMGSLPLGKNEI
jgi:hypothetical protein